MRERGFTILELIVVFAIIAILSTVGIAAFVSYGRTQALQTSVSEVSVLLNLAKSRSLSQIKPSVCASQILNGYQVVISLPDKYQMDVVCSGFPYKIQGKTLPTNITFGNQTYPLSYFFPIIVSGVQPGTGTIVLTGYGQQKTITVTSIGGIQ